MAIGSVCGGGLAGQRQRRRSRMQASPRSLMQPTTCESVTATCAYDEAIAHGLSIETGIIEGVCRYLVKGRMDPGARWTLAGSEAVLRLRALRASGGSYAYWQVHLREELRRNHAERYAGSSPPDPLPRQITRKSPFPGPESISIPLFHMSRDLREGDPPHKRRGNRLVAGARSVKREKAGGMQRGPRPRSGLRHPRRKGAWIWARLPAYCHFGPDGRVACRREPQLTLRATHL